MENAGGNVTVRKDGKTWMSRKPSLVKDAQSQMELGSVMTPRVQESVSSTFPGRSIPMTDAEKAEVVNASNQAAKWVEGTQILRDQIEDPNILAAFPNQVAQVARANTSGNDWSQWTKEGLQDNQVEFVRRVGPAAEMVAQKLNVPVGGIISQWALESGWGKSKLAKDGHNYGGFKTGSKWGGKTMNLTTKEKNATETIKDDFRAYDTVEDFGNDAVDFLSMKRYKPVHGSKTPYDYALALGKAGYHQDTPEKYAGKIKKISERLGI